MHKIYVPWALITKLLASVLAFLNCVLVRWFLHFVHSITFSGKDRLAFSRSGKDRLQCRDFKCANALLAIMTTRKFNESSKVDVWASWFHMTQATVQ